MDPKVCKILSHEAFIHAAHGDHEDLDRVLPLVTKCHSNNPKAWHTSVPLTDRYSAFRSTMTPKRSFVSAAIASAAAVCGTNPVDWASGTIIFR